MSVWQEIKNKLSVEAVIGEYINIESSGSNYKCICPFHNENTPSMMISPGKQIWHCFGCGAGGDIFKFVEDYENLTKQETLQKLAKKAGVKLDNKQIKKDKKSPAQISRYEQGLRLLDWTKNTYHRILLNTLSQRENPLTKYCLGRGLDQEIIERFEIGYAPKKNFIIALADKYNLDKKLLGDIGILGQNKYGKPKDKFIDRLMIPIHDQKNNTVGFTGRVLPWDELDRPKYLNSPQNDWFNKSEIWFGLNLARNTINKEKSAILVEGNMDVIASHQKALTNTVASQGTSFTTNQLQILKRFTPNIQIAFDNDNAGQIAGQKLFLEASKIGFEIEKLIIPPQFKDIDEYLQTNPSKENIKTESYLDWYIESNNRNFISTNSKQQRDHINSFIDLIIYLDNLSREQYLKKISKLTDINYNTLDHILRERISKIPKKQGNKENREDENTINKSKNVDDRQNNLRVSFQKLIAGRVNRHNLAELFSLLKYLVSDFQNFDNLDEYLSEKKEEIDLLAENDQSLSNKDHIISIFTAIGHTLDQNIHKFILDEDLKEIYINIKNIDKNQLFKKA